MLHLGRPIENRPWYTSYRGPLAIHAGAVYNEHQVPYAALLAKIATGKLPEFAFSNEPRGAILATVDLTDCVHIDNLSPDLQPWAYPPCGQWAFVFENIRPLPRPIPYKGRQGFFEIPDHLFAA